MANLHWLSVFGCLLSVVSLGTSHAPWPPAQNYTGQYDNPIRLRAPDPSIVYADGAYSIVYTSDTHIQMTRAKTLDSLLSGETRIFWDDDTPERARHLWAPEIHQIDDRWYVFYSSCDIRVPCCETCKTRVLKGCAGPNPYDCDYSYLATLVPEPGRQGGQFKNESFSIDGTYLEIPGKGRYHVVSARDAGGVQSIQITELDTKSWTVKEWHVISRPDQSVRHLISALHSHSKIRTFLFANRVPVGIQRHELGTVAGYRGYQRSTACTFKPSWSIQA